MKAGKSGMADGEADGTEADRSQILSLVNAMVAAWNRHDAQAFAAVFAEDADFTNVFGIEAKGRARVESTHAVIFRTLFQDSVWTTAATKIRFLSQDIAVVDIRWHLEGSCDPQGNRVGSRHGLMSLVLRRESGRWQILVFHNQDLPSPERSDFYARLWDDKTVPPR